MVGVRASSMGGGMRNGVNQSEGGRKGGQGRRDGPTNEDSEAKHPTYLLSSGIISSSWNDCGCDWVCAFPVGLARFFVEVAFFPFFDLTVASMFGLRMSTHVREGKELR